MPIDTSDSVPAQASADADDAALELMHHLELSIAECNHELQLAEMHEKVFGFLDAQPAAPKASSKAPAPTGAAAKPRGRSKTPPKSRGTTTTPAAPTVTPTGARVPAAARRRASHRVGVVDAD